MINKRSLIAKINKVVSGEGSGSVPVVFKHGNKKLDFKSIELKEGVVVIDVVPAKKSEDDKAKETEKGTKETGTKDVESGDKK